MIVLKTAEVIQRMRQAGRIVAEVHQAMREKVRPGVTTGELNRVAEEIISRRGAKPSFLGYRGFPASLCTSINEEVVHGIPGKRKLCEGDIISIDVGAIYQGYHGDAALTLPVGEIDPEKARLLKVTEEALQRGVAAAVAGNRIRDISAAVQQCVEAEGFSIVRELCGHGVGEEMHESPDVPNFVSPFRGARLQEGMVIAIEPMVNLGKAKVYTREDEWTVVTVDKTVSAHFEHTVAITASGPIILTLP